MKQKIFYLWRVFGTGLAFSLFGLGGVVLPLLAVVILYFWPGSQMDRHRRARYVVHAIFKVYVQLLVVLKLIALDVDNVEYLSRNGLLIAANHPSLIDVVILIALIPNADCVIKRSLLMNPSMRWFLIMTGYIVNEGGSAFIEASVRSLNNGGNLIIFPEGTRSEEVIGRFQRGCANIALSAARPITPVIINCKPSMLQKHNKWYQIPSQTGHFSLKVRPDISVSAYRADVRSVGVRRLTRKLEDYFSQEWNNYEHRNIELRDSAVNY